MVSQDVEELVELLQENRERQVVVEGKRDKNVLCSLGFNCVLTIRKGIYETTEQLKDNEVLILTDFDSEGKQIAKKLNLFLQPIGYNVDIDTRRKIGRLFGKLKITKIEELRGVLNE
jgi:5S rRNA maturation endonuclease (ribonuclease M5)